MGLPEIYISFETAAVSAVKRSSRGVVALAVTDATKGGAASWQRSCVRKRSIGMPSLVIVVKTSSPFSP